jgi:polar amino acid transport system substrate-binding protein
VVGDDAVLKYMIKKAQAEGRYKTLSVLPFVFEKQNYALALPDESPHLEKFKHCCLSAKLLSGAWSLSNTSGKNRPRISAAYR